jgi:hypothetical protein
VDAYKENADISNGNGDEEVSADFSIKKPKFLDGGVKVAVDG